MKQKPFMVTEAILATQGQRFSNYIMDVFMQITLLVLFANIFLIIESSMGNTSPITLFANLEKNQFALYSISFGLTLFYYNFFEILFSRTFGKFVTKTIVVDENGEKPCHQVIMIRSLCRLIPFFPFSFLGTPTLGWHDRISKTYVVDKKELEEMKRQFSNPNS